MIRKHRIKECYSSTTITFDHLSGVFSSNNISIFMTRPFTFLHFQYVPGQHVYNFGTNLDKWYERYPTTLCKGLRGLYVNQYQQKSLHQIKYMIRKHRDKECHSSTTIICLTIYLKCFLQITHRSS